MAIMKWLKARKFILLAPTIPIVLVGFIVGLVVVPFYCGIQKTIDFITWAMD